MEAAIKSKTAGAECFKSSACESTVSVDERSNRRKRSTGVTVTFSIAMNDTSELLIDQLVQNGTGKSLLYKFTVGSVVLLLVIVNFETL